MLHYLFPLAPLASRTLITTDHTNTAWQSCTTDGRWVFLKHYRYAAGGAREVAALRRMHGLTTVPTLLAYQEEDGTVTALITDYIAQGRDGFVTAVAAARAGQAFAGPAAAIGRGLRRVHWALRDSSHGDFHLAQVLFLPGGAIRIIDFEGEPEATNPTLGSQLRDVAGFIRSLDYAALLGQAPTGWRQAAEAAFRQAYGLVDDAALHEELVAKARYEVDYELRHRPELAWVPQAGLARLLGD